MSRGKFKVGDRVQRVGKPSQTDEVVHVSRVAGRAVIALRCGTSYDERFWEMADLPKPTERIRTVCLDFRVRMQTVCLDF